MPSVVQGNAGDIALVKQGMVAEHVETESLYRKLTFRLIPFLFVCWVINYIDRVNIGFAKIPLSKDLGLSDAAYGFGVGIFFVGYILFEVPSNVLMERIGARQTITRIMVLWGVISCSLAFITSPMQFYIARMLLGAAEAGFYPGIILYLTYWFPSGRRARITSRFLLAIAVSGIVGGPVSGWILHNMVGTLGLRNWQWLFLLEGMPAIIAGIIAYFYLDNGPADARWLSEYEREIITRNLMMDESEKSQGHGHRFVHLLRDPRVYLVILGYTTVPLIGTVLNYWTATIIRQSGIGNIWHIGLLSAIPFVVGATAMLINAWHSDRTLERRWHYFFATFVGAVGCVLLTYFSDQWVMAIACLCLIGVAYFCGTGTFWTIPPAYFNGAAAATGIAMISSLGQFGSLLAPMLLGWLKTHTNSISGGLYVIAAISVLGGAAIALGVPRHALRERRLE
ncbi:MULTISPECIES: MFS transporter [Paraburkholderia]|uniref:Phthalate transporter n=1 Tax=Paraburkholderia dioscoreae TaxID=2604047 RepID=A0A5Q4ZMI6_9BURK|nr:MULTISPECIES: MFS transporter [Paraburkholderia]MDR8395198.1 MFS transporter [Paraburkholderia sp. USG1]VVD33267.1 Phthalate transporter [Paraburkholderia dioscoreae]